MYTFAPREIRQLSSLTGRPDAHPCAGSMCFSFTLFLHLCALRTLSRACIWMHIFTPFPVTLSPLSLCGFLAPQLALKKLYIYVRVTDRERDCLLPRHLSPHRLASVPTTSQLSPSTLHTHMHTHVVETNVDPLTHQMCAPLLSRAAQMICLG